MSSFGEGIQMTPLQLGALASSIANGGTLYYLQYPRTSEEQANFAPRVKRNLNIEALLPEVRDGMLAAVLYGKEQLHIEPVAVPEIDKGDVLVRVRTALTCGTDVKVFRRGYHARMIVPPALFGHELAGDIVAVCAGAANSAKILLNSANDTHPQGLANGSDQVGRNYMFHNSRTIAALCTEPNDTVYQKTLGLNDFYSATKDYEYPMGNIQMVGKSNAEAMRGEKPDLTMLSPQWTLTDVAKHSVDWWLTTEDLPVPENRVTLDADGNIHLAYSHTNLEESGRLYGELKKILNHTGMAQHHVLRKNFYADMNIELAGCAHQAGTCRFGTDPATSVLDTDCKAHELDNLYVVDTSFFPSIGAVNPALTAMANAIRVGEHIANRLA